MGGDFGSIRMFADFKGKIGERFLNGFGQIRVSVSLIEADVVSTAEWFF